MPRSLQKYVTSRSFQVSWKRGKSVTFTCAACGEEVTSKCFPVVDAAQAVFAAGTCSSPSCKTMNLFTDKYGNSISWGGRLGASYDPYYDPATARKAPRPGGYRPAATASLEEPQEAPFIPLEEGDRLPEGDDPLTAPPDVTLAGHLADGEVTREELTQEEDFRPRQEDPR